MATSTSAAPRVRKTLPTAYAVTLHTGLGRNDPRVKLVSRMMWEYLHSHAGPDAGATPIYGDILRHQPAAGPDADFFTLTWHFTLKEWVRYGSILYGILCGAFQRIYPQMYLHVYLPPATPWGPAPGVVEDYPGQQYVDVIGKPLGTILFSDVLPEFVALLSYRDPQGLWIEID